MAGESEMHRLTEEKRNFCNNVRFYLRFMFHFAAVVLMWFTFGAGIYMWRRMFWDDVDAEDPRIWLAKNLAACYLTNWNLVFQTVFFSMSLIYDILEWMGHHESKYGLLLKFCRDIFFTSVVVPKTLFIFCTFWIIHCYDRELDYPRIFDQLVPWWFNHFLHTNIIILVGLETLLQARRYPVNLKIELFLVGLIDGAYAIVHYSVYFFTNRWLYAIFTFMTWWQVCLYQIMIWIVLYVFYGIQFPINRLFHREQPSQEVIQKTEGPNKGTRTRETTAVSDSWSLKFRSKSDCEDIRL